MPVLLCAGLSFPAMADTGKDGPAVVPEAERKAVAEKNLQGPTQNKGVRSVTPLGVVPLGEDFPALQGRQLRARVIVVEPGGVVAVHEHRQRPGVAYILEGHIHEHRQGEPKPVLKGPGAVAFEKSGVVHWWENRSKRIVRALVIDIVPEEVK
jgi:quercetin dioxygenase-like cupin family protein